MALLKTCLPPLTLTVVPHSPQHQSKPAPDPNSHLTLAMAPIPGVVCNGKGSNVERCGGVGTESYLAPTHTFPPPNALATLSPAHPSPLPPFPAYPAYPNPTPSSLHAASYSTQPHLTSPPLVRR